MFTAIGHFLSTWRHESASTARLFAELTDASLAQRVAPGHRTLGELAWHIVVSQREIVGKTGLVYDAPRKGDPAPARAAALHSAYVDAAKAFAAAVEREWNDDALRIKDTLYGASWPRGVTLSVTLRHEIHHRGQMTVLMRQAGLRVPGVYGASKDERQDD